MSEKKKEMRNKFLEEEMKKKFIKKKFKKKKKI